MKSESETHSVMSGPLQPLELSRPEYWGRLPFPSQGDLSNTGIEPRSPALQVDSSNLGPENALSKGAVLT